MLIMLRAVRYKSIVYNGFTLNITNLGYYPLNKYNYTLPLNLGVCLLNKFKDHLLYKSSQSCLP